jgi:hypothetical protein
MNKQFWVLAICAAVGAGIGVVIAESIAPAYVIKLIIIALGSGIGVFIGAQLSRK